MSPSDPLTIPYMMIVFLGLLFVLGTIYEYWKLRTIRDDFDKIRKELQEDHFRAQKASHRVIASYNAITIEQKISLLQSAVEIDPHVFNGYNALGYAWLEKEEVFRAVDAFNKAVEYHPEEEAGYFDLAHVYLKQGQPVMAVEMLERAVKINPSSKSDLLNNPLFSALGGDARFQSLLKSAPQVAQ